MKVLLINPPIEISQGEFTPVIAPLGLAYIAAVLEKENHEVKILDCIALSWKNTIKIKRGKEIIQRYSPSDSLLKKYILDFKPDVVGISNLVSPTELETIKMARFVKKLLPATKVVIGGSNASFRINFFIKDKSVDFVIVFEGEETMKDLLDKLPSGRFENIPGLIFKTPNHKTIHAPANTPPFAAGMKRARERHPFSQKGNPATRGGEDVIINPPRPFIKNVDSLPFPAWHLLPMEEYLSHQPAGIFVKKKRAITMITSRGCPNGCIFCTNAAIWGRLWRPRSVENVTREIKALKKLYQIEEIQFVDNNISVLKDRYIKLCRVLKKEKLPWLPSGGLAVLTLNPQIIKLMAQSGCYAVQFGIEHGDAEMQKKISKIVPLAATRKLTDACHKYGIWTHGNFIIGLPGETEESARRSLEYAMKADLDSVSFFTALPLPGSKLFEIVKRNKKIDLAGLKFYTSNTQCSDIPPRKIKTMIKTFFREFLLFKIKRELNPINLVKRLSSVRSLDDLKFYFIMLRRFLQIEKIN